VTKRTAAKIDTSDLAELIIEAKGTQSWKHYLMQIRNVAIQRRLVEEGMNLREVADDIGIAKSVVHRVAQELNIDLRPEPSPGPRRRRSVTG
jgi:transposase